MSTLVEIEKAATELSADEQKLLLRFLLRIIPADDSAPPEPRLFSVEQLRQWMDQDEAAMREFERGAT